MKPCIFESGSVTSELDSRVGAINFWRLLLFLLWRCHKIMENQVKKKKKKSKFGNYKVAIKFKQIMVNRFLWFGYSGMKLQYFLFHRFSNFSKIIRIRNQVQFPDSVTTPSRPKIIPYSALTKLAESFRSLSLLKFKVIKYNEKYFCLQIF